MSHCTRRREDSLTTLCRLGHNRFQYLETYPRHNLDDTDTCLVRDRMDPAAFHDWYTFLRDKGALEEHQATPKMGSAFGTTRKGGPSSLGTDAARAAPSSSGRFGQDLNSGAARTNTASSQGGTLAGSRRAVKLNDRSTSRGRKSQRSPPKVAPQPAKAPGAQGKAPSTAAKPPSQPGTAPWRNFAETNKIKADKAKDKLEQEIAETRLQQKAAEAAKGAPSGAAPKPQKPNAKPVKPIPAAGATSAAAKPSPVAAGTPPATNKLFPVAADFTPTTTPIAAEPTTAAAKSTPVAAETPPAAAETPPAAEPTAAAEKSAPAAATTPAAVNVPSHEYTGSNNAWADDTVPEADPETDSDSGFKFVARNQRGKQAIVAPPAQAAAATPQAPAKSYGTRQGKLQGKPKDTNFRHWDKATGICLNIIKYGTRCRAHDTLDCGQAHNPQYITDEHHAALLEAFGADQKSALILMWEAKFEEARNKSASQVNAERNRRAARGGTRIGSNTKYSQKPGDDKAGSGFVTIGRPYMSQ